MMCDTFTGVLILAIFINSAHAKTHLGPGTPGGPCEMGGGVMGRCENIGSCLADGGVVQRSSDVTVCKGDFGSINVCCRKPLVIAKELCDAWSHFWRGSDGKCNVDHPLIIGGTTANIGEFPHMVLLGRKYRSKTINYSCGGTLVSPHFVLTAAHCLLNHRPGMTYWAKLGEHDLEHDATATPTEVLKGSFPTSLYQRQELVSTSSTGDTAPVEQVIQVVEQFIHPDYPVTQNYHDIALLKLERPAQLTRRVLPACLPFQNPAEDYRGQTLTVTGWGITSGVREMSRTLQKVDVPVMDRLSCSVRGVNNQKTPLGITEDMLCAGELGKDSCGGDSGGPLTTRVLRNGSACEHTLVGVVSYGIGVRFNRCGALGVYGRVSSYLDWITGYIAPNVTQI